MHWTCVQCAPAFDSLEQLEQSAGATALLFNPMGKALEIRTWLVLVAFMPLYPWEGEQGSKAPPKNKDVSSQCFRWLFQLKYSQHSDLGSGDPNRVHFIAVRGGKNSPWEELISVAAYQILCVGLCKISGGKSGSLPFSWLSLEVLFPADFPLQRNKQAQANKQANP